MTVVRVVLILIVFVVLLVVALFNVNDAHRATNVWLGRDLGPQPLAVVMLYAFAFGGLCVGIFTVISEIRLRTRLYRQQREIDALMEELRALRNAPLETETTKQTADRRTGEDRQ